MSSSEALVHVASGKVRELFTIDDERLLLVASDRISTFDVILPTEIPDKGRVLTGLSGFWFTLLREIVPNHMLAIRDDGRSMECRRLEMLPIECVVRGYLAGSGWKDYRGTGAIGGTPLPAGLLESDRLPAPILTPSTKAESGSHDENIDLDEMIDLLSAMDRDGRPLGSSAAGELAGRVRDAALALYGYGAAVTARAGILLADTKFEFGLAPDGELLVVDELLTPDSSRFWDAAAYEPGRAQASYDKQYVRDWLEIQPWAKTAPGPGLPADVVAGTRARYVEAFERITGASFTRYLQEDVIAR